MEKIEVIKNGSEPIGSRTRAKVVKNKVAPPFKEAEFDIMYGKGISKEGELVDMGLNFEILKRSGAWFYYGETRLGQGKDNVKQLFTDNKELAEEIEGKILEKYQAAFEKKNGDGEKADSEPAIMPVDTADIEPKRPRKTVNIDIAVDD